MTSTDPSVKDKQEVSWSTPTDPCSHDFKKFSGFQASTSVCRLRIFVSDHTIQTWSNLSSIERYNGGQWSSTVKDGLLQACVLLTTQGDNSRIRWSTSQECQHVLSSDIKPYNKKLLDTSHTLLQEVTLPVNFMLRNVSTLAPGFEAGVRLLQGDRRPSTVKSYDQKWFKFETSE